MALGKSREPCVIDSGVSPRCEYLRAGVAGQSSRERERERDQERWGIMSSGLGWQGKLAFSKSQVLLWNQTLPEKSQRDRASQRCV